MMTSTINICCNTGFIGRESACLGETQKEPFALCSILRRAKKDQEEYYQKAAKKFNLNKESRIQSTVSKNFLLVQVVLKSSVDSVEKGSFLVGRN
ncbi:hypothetical protein K7X08_014085 [Anisodus acutangulus]|uniref:Uncharacterized protein n=1 Tax=Anisodus acutangulus TaxID=402998 RepID=A0A9Q1LPP7_9SOLA|nr:hypothetical protein K7X08_014085 [Anisodus acutangulus]